MGFLFGVAAASLLVAVAFIVYDRVMSTQPVAVVDNSRSPRCSRGGCAARWTSRSRRMRPAGWSAAMSSLSRS